MKRDKIKNYIIDKIRTKLNGYSPETDAMPFHYRLLGRDRMALYSFIHSVNTTLGQSIFEQIGKMIAEGNKSVIKALNGYNMIGFISSEAVIKIDTIERGLLSASLSPDKVAEIEMIKEVSNKGEKGKEIKKIADLFMETNDIEYYFEIKTAKPNIDVFKATKKKLLEWVAMRNSNGNLNKKIKTVVAIPYNPYEPEPYQRWTLRGLFDMKEEVLVGKEFWDLLGGENTYETLLDIFEQAGLEIYDEIEEKMKFFKK